MDDLERFVQEQCASDPQFRAAWEAGEETARLGRIVARVRGAKGISVGALAEQVGWSEEQVKDLEIGRAVTVSIEDLFRLGQPLGFGVRVQLEEDQAC